MDPRLGIEWHPGRLMWTAAGRNACLAFWFTAEAVQAWQAEPRTTRGGQPDYSALAILTALTLRAVFRLPFRQTEGLIGSVIGLLGLAASAVPTDPATLASSDIPLDGFVTGTGPARKGPSGRDERHAATVAACHCSMASERKVRSVRREIRWRWRLKVL